MPNGPCLDQGTLAGKSIASLRTQGRTSTA
jgi:hypothetical protein